MPVAVLNDLMKQAELLTGEEQLQLAICLINKARQKKMPRSEWKQLCGSVTYPALGEDAQIWVSRNRLESDINREKQWLKK